MKHSWMLLLMAIMIGVAGCALATDADSHKSAHKKTATIPYALDTCPVTGEKLGAMGAPVVKVYDGREVKFCCAGCPAKFEKDLKANFKKLDNAIADSKKKSGEKAAAAVSGKTTACCSTAACKCGAAGCKCKADGKAAAACTKCKSNSGFTMGSKADVKPMACCSMAGCKCPAGACKCKTDAKAKAACTVNAKACKCATKKADDKK